MIDTLVYRRRYWANKLAMSLFVIMTIVALYVLGDILTTLILRGIGGLTANLFILNTPPPGSTGGLANAIVGSLILSGLGIIIAVPIGILSGIYLAEYGRDKRISIVIRFLNDILLSAPSICIGMFVYEIMVVPMHSFSGYAGIVSLAIIAIPIIVRTTEDMLYLVPSNLREAAAALGAPRWHVICFVCVPMAKSGIITGILLALARIAGETAPLLFTALNNQFWSLDLGAPMANLPTAIYNFAMSPYADWQQLAWAGALLITGSILTLNIVARILSKTRKI